MMEHRGVKVILTDHSRQQALRRHGMPIEQMKVFFQHAINGIDDAGFMPEYYNQEVFIYSKTFQRGMIVAFRRDFKNQDNWHICLVAVTVYPYGVSRPAHKDTVTIYV
jgi:hypothetical protein